MRHLLVASFASALVVLVAAPRPAAACSPAFNDPLVADAAFAGDTVAPAAPVAADVGIHRDDGSGVGGCGTCGDLTSVSLELSATDDRAPAERLGYELTLVAGTLPPGLALPDGPVVPGGGGGVVYLFFDGDAPDVYFELEVRTIDLNGNRSAPTVVVFRDRADDGGCAAGGRMPRAPGTALVALALVVALRRRVRRA